MHNKAGLVEIRAGRSDTYIVGVSHAENLDDGMCLSTYV